MCCDCVDLCVEMGKGVKEERVLLVVQVNCVVVIYKEEGEVGIACGLVMKMGLVNQTKDLFCEGECDIWCGNSGGLFEVAE